ncbi:MAG: HEAT repeat domain-containing protein, partial [Phycisphaerae bacterium]|nr:HEAT repeat domain-containing protein [Phycisphaerae bacterium]
MDKSSKHNTDSGLSKPLSERERRHSQRAFIVMAVLITISFMLMGPSGIFGIYMIQLGVSGPQLGKLIAWVTPFGIAGIFCAGLAVRVGRKRMLRWSLLPSGLLMLALLLLPNINHHWNLAVMLAVGWGLLAAQRMAQSVTEVPWFPIIQMITLPNRRGAFLGRMRLVWGLASAVALFGVARLLGQEAQMTTLMVLIAVAAMAYWLMFWPLRHIVEHRTRSRPRAVSWTEAWRAIKASPLLARGIAVTACSWFATSIFAVFQLYFLTKSLRWSHSAAVDVVWVTILGLALSNVFWGAVADRLGDRAVAQLAFLGVVISGLCWVIAGSNSLLAKSIVFTGAFGIGVFRAGVMMSTTRVILNHVPERVSPVLLSFRKVFVVLATTSAAALGSLILKWLDGWRITRGDNWLILDGYKVLFLIAAGVWLAQIWLCRKFPGVPGRTPWTVLAAMFNRPFQTIWMVSRIDSALPENDRLNLVHRLSQTDSPLAYEGLVAGLRDASYDVRLASVNALASRTEPESCQALLEALDQPELDIQPEAAWALGELGDPRAVPELIIALGSSNQLLRGRAARALGKLDAHQALPNLQRMLMEDGDSFVRRSAAIALSRLNVRESLTAVFEQFRSAKTRLGQRELALALANLVHGGDLYYRIRRQEAQGMADVLEEAVDEALGEEAVDHEGRRCFEQMV